MRACRSRTVGSKRPRARPLQLVNDPAFVAHMPRGSTRENQVFEAALDPTGEIPPGLGALLPCAAVPRLVVSGKNRQGSTRKPTKNCHLPLAVLECPKRPSEPLREPPLMRDMGTGARDFVLRREPRRVGNRRYDCEREQQHADHEPRGGKSTRCGRAE